MRILPLLLLSLVALVAPLRAQNPAPPAPNLTEVFEARTFTGPEGALPYRLLKPQDYDAKQKYPLVLFMHGAGERGTDNAAQLKHGAGAFAKPEARGKFPCFVVAPQCPPNLKWVDIDWTSTFPNNPARATS